MTAPMMLNVLEIERNKSKFDELKNIKEEKNSQLDQPDELESILNNDPNKIASEDDLEFLSLLVQERIEAFKAIIPKMKERLEDISSIISLKLDMLNSKCVKFKFAPAKDQKRAYVKILQNVKSDKKFPLEKLKDIARGSFFFLNPAEL